MPPIGNGSWQLFDIQNDPGETNDLSRSKPEIFDDLLASYAAYAESVGVLEMPQGYDPTKMVEQNSSTRFLSQNPGLVAAIVAVLAGLIFAMVKLTVTARRRRSG